MRDPIYRKLARRLDSLPQGFPSTAEGIELRILERIFSPEDAAWALRIKPFPETAGGVARRLNLPEAEVQNRLETMAANGQIAAFKFRGKQCYALMPFVVGIYEMQLNRLDRELAELVEAYAPYLAKTLGGPAPGLARVVPVNKSIDTRASVLATDDLRKMLERARSFRVADCICRKEQEVLGNPCKHTMETCLAFSSEEGAYDDGPDFGRVISRDQAMTLLDACEREGLIHCTYNFERSQMFVCNCCSCCCGFIRLLTEHEAPNGLVRSNWVATIDPESCLACGVCRNERCPVDAIEAGKDAYCVMPTRCIGCGVCILTCPAEAIALQARPEPERTTPPRDIVEWSVERVWHRNPVRGAVLKGWLAWEHARKR